MSAQQIAPVPEHVCYVHCNFCNTILAVNPIWSLCLPHRSLPLSISQFFASLCLWSADLQGVDAWNDWLRACMHHRIVNFVGFGCSSCWISSFASSKLFCKGRTYGISESPPSCRPSIFIFGQSPLNFLPSLFNCRFQFFEWKLLAGFLCLSNLTSSLHHGHEGRRSRSTDIENWMLLAPFPLIKSWEQHD